MSADKIYIPRRPTAEAASRAVPGSSLIFTGEHGQDSRTYRVSFSRILSELEPWYKPAWNLDRGGEELVNFFQLTNFKEEDFRGWRTNRLEMLKKLIDTSLVNTQLSWS